MNDLDRSRKSIILQMGKEQNIAVAAENIFNKFKDRTDIYLFENNKFENLLILIRMMKTMKLWQIDTKVTELICI